MWRRSFIATFLERDIPQMGGAFLSKRCADCGACLPTITGSFCDASRLGESLGLSHTTVRSYVDVLQRTFMIRELPPFLPNLKKRLVKSPKTFLHDTGILQALLGLDSYD